MINAEELKELIEKDAIVYGVYREYDDYGHYDNIIEEQDLSEGYYIDVYEKYGITGILDDLKNTYDNLFETKSEAEFDAKYKNIQRTEYLDLPTWEEAEIDKIVKISNNKNYCWYLIKSFTDKKNNEMFEFSLSKDDDQFYLSVNNEDSSYKDLFEKSLTCENYLKACEICRKLFLGEEV